MVALPTLVLWASLATSADTRLVEFVQPNCQNCRQMDAIVRRLQANGHVIERVNALEHPDVVQRFGVTGTPTYVLLVDGQPTQKIVGAASFDKLVELLGGTGAGNPSPAAAPHAAAPHAGTPQAAAPPGAPAPPLDASDAMPRGRTVAVEQPRAANGSAVSPRGPIPGNPAGNARGSSPGNAPGGAPLSVPASNAVAARERSPLAPGETPEQRALQATVRLRVNDESGTSVATGTIIDIESGNALILTCAHVFRASRGKGEILVDLFVPGAGQPLVGELVDFDFYRDIALVSIQPTLPVRPVPVAAADKVGEVATVVFSVGCDNGGQPRVERARITRLNRYSGPPNIEVSGAPTGGRSGGGLFSAEGELVGVCNAANEPENEGIYAALATVHWQLQQVGLSRLVPPSGGSPTNEPAADVENVAGLLSGEDEELVVTVRRKSRPNDPGRSFVLDRPDPRLVEQLARGARPVMDRPIDAPMTPAMPMTPTDVREPLIADQQPVGLPRGNPRIPEAKTPVMRGQQPSGVWPFGQ